MKKLFIPIFLVGLFLVLGSEVNAQRRYHHHRSMSGYRPRPHVMISLGTAMGGIWGSGYWGYGWGPRVGFNIVIPPSERRVHSLPLGAEKRIYGGIAYYYRNNTFYREGEDAHLLFGFADAKEKDIFLQLLTVSGIGANTARLILSYMKPEEVSLAIINGDSKSLEKVKGIGKKTAERAVLELRDKIGKQYPEITISPNHQFVNTIKQDALEALQALGINRQMAEQHVIKILQTEPELQVEALIKKVLKGI